MSKFTQAQTVAIGAVAVQFGIERMQSNPSFYLDKATKISIDSNQVSTKYPNLPCVGLFNGVDIDEDPIGISLIGTIRESISDAFKKLPKEGKKKFEPKVQEQSAGWKEPEPVQISSMKVTAQSKGYDAVEKQRQDAFQSPKIEEPIPEPKKEPEKPAVTIVVCRTCRTEISHAKGLECLKENRPPSCDDCDEKANELKPKEKSMTEPIPNFTPAIRPETKTKMTVGTSEAVAQSYGIPVELANLFFMKMNDQLYIKNPGLLYLAGKKGYSRIEITDSYDQDKKEWSAECRIYPKLTKDIIESVSKLEPTMQKTAFEFLTNPTNGTGKASISSVKMSTMHIFLREMSQTRAMNRALRAFCGYGGTSAEELPEAVLERQ